MVARVAFFVGVALALASLVVWVALPIGKFIRYLVTSGELSRVRARAVGTTLAALLALAAGLGVVPLPHHCRLEGVVEAAVQMKVHAGADGFIVDTMPSGHPATPDGEPVVRCANPELDRRWAELRATAMELNARLRLAEAENVQQVRGLQHRLVALRQEMGRVGALREKLDVRPEEAGTWIAPNVHLLKGRYVERGRLLGEVAGLDHLLIRAVANQRKAAWLIDEARHDVEFRPRGRPQVTKTGRLMAVLPAGKKELPGPQITVPAGGETPADPLDPAGRTAAERTFEVRVGFEGGPDEKIRPGAVVVVRFELRPKPLLARAYRLVRQVFQERFHV
jgi:putative peptide zinc metalloprotease protein